MSYTALYRKWRPETFSEVKGQDAIVKTLKNQVATSHTAHAYLFNGTRGTGKTSVAKIMAKAVNCENPIDGEPCLKCNTCLSIAKGSNLNIREIDAASNNGVDNIREIKEDVIYKPTSGKYKVYIIDEVHMLSAGAFNALLKTLEEPPEYGVIILMTSSLEALLPTIQSRCVLLNMRPVRDELVQKYLMEQLQVPDYRAKLCTAFARGNIGQAKLLASSEDFDRVREEAVTLLKYINEMEITELAAAVRKITEYQLDMTDYLDIISVWYRDVLMFKAMNDANHLIFREEIQYIKRVADRSSYEGLEKILDALEKAKARLRANVSFELTMELLFLTIQENT